MKLLDRAKERLGKAADAYYTHRIKGLDQRMRSKGKSVFAGMKHIPAQRIADYILEKGESFSNYVQSHMNTLMTLLSAYIHDSPKMDSRVYQPVVDRLVELGAASITLDVFRKGNRNDLIRESVVNSIGILDSIVLPIEGLAEGSIGSYLGMMKKYGSQRVGSQAEDLAQHEGLESYMDHLPLSLEV